ncbi:hypothetical protein ACVBEH_28525, partial [Roseateles sp. GG27B]
QQAVLFAAFFNVLAIGVFQLKVAATVGSGIVNPSVVDHHVVFGALIGAIACNVNSAKAIKATQKPQKKPSPPHEQPLQIQNAGNLAGFAAGQPGPAPAISL